MLFCSYSVVTNRRTDERTQPLMRERSGKRVGGKTRACTTHPFASLISCATHLFFPPFVSPVEHILRNATTPYKRDCIITRAGGEIYCTAPFTNVLVTIWSCVVAIETLWYYMWPPKSDFQNSSPFKI